MKNASRILRRLLCALLAALLLSAAVVPALAVGQSTTLAKFGDKYIVRVKKLNVRSGPGIGYRVTKHAKKGQNVTYLGKSKGWWLVELPSGKLGWVDKQYLTRSNMPRSGIYVSTTKKVKVYKSPKTSAKKLGSLKKGTSVYLDYLNGDWGLIYYNGRSGWVPLKYLRK